MLENVKTRRLGPFPKVSLPVFGISALLILIFIVYGALFTEQASELFSTSQTFITTSFGWFFILLMNAAALFALFIAFSRFGYIRLGAQTDTPEYSLLSWTAMLFSAGVGIGLMYWGVAEPLYHFFAPPLADPESIAAAEQAMEISFLHWGIHAWGLYAVVALSLAYFHYRKGLPLSIRSTLYPLLGKKIYGPWGHLIDILAVFGTMFGIVTSLGLGVMQVNAGLTNLFGIANNTMVQIGLIAGITTLAAISVMAGLDKGIKRLSNLNIGLTFALLLFVVVLGPTLFIFDSFIENVGNYASSVVKLGLWGESYSGTDWQAGWTIFYWAWWVSWSPFVGVFIARISKGRTIREFLLGVLFIPMFILFFWFTAFGGTAVNMELMGDPGLIEATKQSYGDAIFKLMEFFPFTDALTLLVVVMIVIWFVTSSDSGSFVIDMLTAGGDTDPPKIQRLFWAITEGIIAAILLVAGGLNALQAASIVAGFPFAIVIMFMMYSLWRALGRDHLILYRSSQWYETEKMVEANQPDAYRDEQYLTNSADSEITIVTDIDPIVTDNDKI